MAWGAESGLADVVSGALEGGLTETALEIVADSAGSGEVLGVVCFVSFEDWALFVERLDCLASEGLLHLIWINKYNKIP